MLHKRDLGGTIVVDGPEFDWELTREPQLCTADGWQGLLIGVCCAKGGREALLQFPMPKGTAQRTRGYRHRPQVQRAELEEGIRKALSAGWEGSLRARASRSTSTFSVSFEWKADTRPLSSADGICL
jgi:hypothetical protein